MEKALRWFCLGIVAASLMWCMRAAPGVGWSDGFIDAAHAQDAGTGPDGGEDCAECCRVPCVTRTVYAGEIGQDGFFDLQLPDFDGESLPAVLVYQLGNIGAPPDLWIPVNGFELKTSGLVRVYLPSEGNIGRKIQVVVIR